MNLPAVPVMTEFDESWIDWASKTYGVRPNIVRGMLAGFYTMRARAFPEGLAAIARDIRGGELALEQLPTHEKEHPREAAADREMWGKLLPQLRELAR